jgi:hypothetical protein
MTDPLAGKKQAINEGSAYSLMWPDTGKGCPVSKGELFELRSCRIEITKTHRVKKDRKWWHRAEFARYPKSTKPVFLARRGGLTPDRKQAMAAQDSPDPGTLRMIQDDERSPVAAAQHAALGAPPEPEAVPKEEIAAYEGSREARQRYELEVARQRAAEAKAPLEVRVARLREASAAHHVDISSEMRVIEQRVEAAERKVLERAA